MIIIGSLVALAERLHGGRIEWGVILPFAAAAAVGVLVGSGSGARLHRALTRWFALFVVATAIYMATEAIMALL